MPESFEMPQNEALPETELPQEGEVNEEEDFATSGVFETEPPALEILEDEETSVMALVEEALPPEVREELARETEQELPSSEEETGLGRWISAHPRLKKSLHALALTTSLVAPMVSAPKEASAESNPGRIVEMVVRGGTDIARGNARSEARQERTAERIQDAQMRLDERIAREKERLAARNISPEERARQEMLLAERHAQEQDKLNTWAERERDRVSSEASRQRSNNAGRLLKGIFREVTR